MHASGDTHVSTSSQDYVCHHASQPRFPCIQPVVGQVFAQGLSTQRYANTTAPCQHTGQLSKQPPRNSAANCRHLAFQILPASVLPHYSYTCSALNCPIAGSFHSMLCICIGYNTSSVKFVLYSKCQFKTCPVDQPLKEMGTQNLVKQDNTSTIKMVKGGVRVCGPRTRSIHIRYFYATERVKDGTIVLTYCLIKEMVADYPSKPLQGSLF